MRLAFFPADSKVEEPDYELGQRPLDNGVSQDMTIDYTDYVIHARLDDIEPLPRPSCRGQEPGPAGPKKSGRSARPVPPGGRRRCR